ncbi:polyketide biosynthesis methyltransferase [Prauserella marina]|nr:polyketide biosynthesis methyltransferase [Prauserella marina]
MGKDDDGPVDLERPSAGRIYDYLLGRTNNYAIDREFADQQISTSPGLGEFARANRAFLGRAVRYAVETGVRQFVDIGSGLPTQGNVHEIADEVARGEALVAYVDNEPIAHAHSQILLEDTADPARHFAVVGDYFDGAELWESIMDTTPLNPDEPICLLTVALLHLMPPEKQPEAMLADYRDRLPRGSLLVLSHGSVAPDHHELRESAGTVIDNYKRSTHRVHLRAREEITDLFGDFALVDPGLVWIPEWRPSEPVPADPAAIGGLCGVGRKN